MGRLMQGLRNLSIRKTFILYMFVFIIAAALLSVITVGQAGEMMNRLFLKYNPSYTVEDINDPAVIYNIEMINTDYSPRDQRWADFLRFLDSWSVPIYFAGSIISAALLFYRNKLEKPIKLIRNASEKITNHDLDFHIHYDCQDEMGKLCESLERMRTALDQNNRMLWQAVEERKRLNAAFSHDLRTPLTVLTGYTDFMKNYIPSGRMPTDQIVSTLDKMSNQIMRMKQDVDAMSAAQRLEDVQYRLDNVEIASLTEQLQNICDMFTQGKRFAVVWNTDLTVLHAKVDANLVIRVFENLMGNSARYARNHLEIELRFIPEYLILAVHDDGHGFSPEDRKKAFVPFYRGEHANGQDRHSGLGLYICKTLVEKHGGTIDISNNETGGATVQAMFKLG